MMKKLISLLCLLMLFSCALAEDAAPIDERLSKFDEYVYSELSMSEIPEGELTEELLRELEDAQAARLLNSVLPRLVEQGYIRELPFSAYLDYEGTLWRDYSGSNWDLMNLAETTPIEELPRYTAHLTPDCDPAASYACNYFALYFFSVETLFDPCPKCFPEGWVYDYLVTPGIDGTNRMRITPWFDAQPGAYDQPRELMLHFDHETDECLAIAVEYYQQGFILVYQDEDFAIDGIMDCCPECYDRDTQYFDWRYHEPGVWHCRNCGVINSMPLEY